MLWPSCAYMTDRLKRDRLAPGIDSSTPVVVLRLAREVFPHGSLGVVRTLGRLGVRTWAFHDDHWAPAVFSRYDAGKLVVRLDALAPIATLAYLRKLSHAHGKPAIL